jgi:8-oxo-dGTP diphosphatase
MSPHYDYARPSVTVDCVVFGLDKNGLHVLLIQRANEPFKDQWAFPGGFIEMNESLEASALRELEEETGLKDLDIVQVGAFGDPNRDPRERVITVAYFAVTILSDQKPIAASDAREVKWFPVKNVPTLAFDHQKILEKAVSALESDTSPRSAIEFSYLREIFPSRIKNQIGRYE